MFLLRCHFMLEVGQAEFPLPLSAGWQEYMRDKFPEQEPNETTLRQDYMRDEFHEQVPIETTFLERQLNAEDRRIWGVWAHSICMK